MVINTDYIMSQMRDILLCEKGATMFKVHTCTMTTIDYDEFVSTERGTDLK